MNQFRHTVIGSRQSGDLFADDRRPVREERERDDDRRERENDRSREQERHRDQDEHRERGIDRVRALHEAAERLDRAGMNDMAQEIRHRAEEMERELDRHDPHHNGHEDGHEHLLRELIESNHQLRGEIHELHRKLDRLADQISRRHTREETIRIEVSEPPTIEEGTIEAIDSEPLQLNAPKIEVETEAVLELNDAIPAADDFIPLDRDTGIAE